MKKGQELVDEASDIVYARIMDGTASGGDRACYYVLSTSAFRLVDGLNTLEARDTARAIQERLAWTVVMDESTPKACDLCGVAYKLVQQCENEDCPADRDDD